MLVIVLCFMFVLVRIGVLGRVDFMVFRFFMCVVLLVICLEMRMVFGMDEKIVDCVLLVSGCWLRLFVNFVLIL